MEPIVSIIPPYAAVLALLYVVLSIRTLRLRRKLRIPIGDARDPLMQRAMRVHANFAEYTPLALLLILMVELGDSHDWLIHGLGVSLVLGRVSHAFGVSKPTENFRYRVFGMAMTFSAMIVASTALLFMTAASISFSA